MATAITGSRRGSRLFVGVVALVVGAALGRFVTYEPPSTRTVSVAPASVAAGRGSTAGLEQAVRTDPTDLASWQALGAAYVRTAIETGNPAYYDLAERSLQNAAALAPADADTALVRGQLALTRHDFADALAFGRQAGEGKQRSADALLLIADAEVELGRYEEAAATLQQALDIRPDLAALSRASYLRELHGDLDGALLLMEQARTAGAGAAFDGATVSALVGDLLLRSGDVEAASVAYEQALDAAPGLVAAETGRARALAAGGRSAEAIEVLEAVLQRFPAAAPALLLGDLRSMAGDAQAADEAYDLVRATARLQEAAGGVVDLEMAVFEADHGDPAVGLARAEQAYRDRPTVYAADAVAWALYRSGRAGDAVAFVDEALRLGTADPLIRLHAAAVLAEAGERAAAVTELGMAFAGSPWFLPPYGEMVVELAGELGVTVPAAWAGWAS